jgi:hypothetical protein
MSQKLLIELDKAGAEWVVVAYLAGDGRMLDVIAKEQSPHVITGTYISGCSEELVEKEESVVKLQTDPQLVADARDKVPELSGQGYFLPRSMSIRQAGKKANHGLNYGLGYRTFALYNEMQESDAKEIVRRYHEDAYPGIKVWHDSIQRQLNDDRTLTNCFGRKRKFLDRWGQDLFLDAYSFLPQSTVVDMVNQGMIDAYLDEDLQLDLLAQVHDSILIQYPTEELGLLAERIWRIADYMSPTCEYGAREFTIRTTAKVGYDWSNMNEIDISATQEQLANELAEKVELLNETKAG